MGERSPFDDFKARLARARARHDRGAAPGPPPGTWGVALQIAIEMVGALAVSVFIGWVLDDWLATGPLFLVVFFFLGAAAGGLNVYRRAKRLAGGDDNEGSSGSGEAPGRED